MPKLEQGDLEAVESLMRINIPQLLKKVREGYAITSLVPSCTLMFKKELPLLFSDNEDVKQVANAFWDPFHYLLMRAKDGLLNMEFSRSLRPNFLSCAMSRQSSKYWKKDRRVFKKNS